MLVPKSLTTFNFCLTTVNCKPEFLNYQRYRGRRQPGHILRRDPFNVDMALLLAFSQPVLMYINMAKAGLKLDCFFIH